MRTYYYHPSFEYSENYDFENLGTKGISAYTKRIVCPTCNGNGHHFRTDLDENLLVDGMREDGDFEGIEAYKAGRFDQTCTHCNGRNVVDEPDWALLPAWAKKEIEDWEYSEREYEQIRASERAMGA